MKKMTFREMNLRVFQRKPIAHVLFQPRFEPWYAWHKTFNQMPPAYANMEIRDLFDDLQVSMRYIHYYTGVPDPVIRTFDPEVEIIEKIEGRDCDRIYRTPYGDLHEHQKRTVDEEWRTVVFAAKNVDDLKKLRWLYQHTHYSYSAEFFKIGSDFIGERGEPQFWLPKSPYQALALNWMKLEHLIYAIADAPHEVEETLKAIDDSYDPLLEQICQSETVKIINFGENIHEALFSPRYFERYLLPYYEKRGNQLKAAGIFSHIHIDGYFTSLLPYLKDLPFDGIEALTPTPQGDVPLEVIKEHIGDKILLDGIPAVLFMDTYSREDLLSCAQQVVDLFYPNLILGVSDEVPEGTGREAIERLRLVSEWCRRWQPPA